MCQTVGETITLEINGKGKEPDEDQRGKKDKKTASRVGFHERKGIIKLVQRTKGLKKCRENT